MELFFQAFQTHLSSVCRAVPFDVPQSLLDDAKNTERRFSGNTMRNVLLRKIDLYFQLLRELLAESAHARNQSQTLQLWKYARYVTRSADQRLSH